MTHGLIELQSNSPDETQMIAAAIASVLRPGDTLLLDGPVGAGKSHFARSAILELLPVPEDIPSPTYTLVQTYLTPKGDVWHADLYRVSDPGEIHELGLWTAFEDAVCFVEWPDQLGAQAPPGSLTVKLMQGSSESVRTLTFSWSDEGWNDRLKGVLSDRPAFT